MGKRGVELKLEMSAMWGPIAEPNFFPPPEIHIIIPVDYPAKPEPPQATPPSGSPNPESRSCCTHARIASRISLALSTPRNLPRRSLHASSRGPALGSRLPGGATSTLAMSSKRWRGRWTVRFWILTKLMVRSFGDFEKAFANP